MEKQKTYLNEGAKEFLESLEPGTIPLNPDEENFFEKVEKDILDYLKEKKYGLEENNGTYSSETFLQEYVRKTKSREINVAVLSVDIVGSTKLSRELDKETYMKIIGSFLRGIAQIVHNYNGYVLKYIGDEIIAYFPGKGKQPMHDNALFCAYAIKKYVLKILNPILKKMEIPEIGFRIGLNSGIAMIAILGHPIAREHFDLIGEPINITKKIQTISKLNSILVGESVTSSTHDFWKNKVGEIDLEKFDWGIKVYRLEIIV